jgi:hypothetical protein
VTDAHHGRRALPTMDFRTDKHPSCTSSLLSPASPIDATRVRFLATRICGLGERPLYELLRELDRGADLTAVLERYARLALVADVIHAHDGDYLQPPRVVMGWQ